MPTPTQKSSFVTVPTNARDKLCISTFYNDLSSLFGHIPKDNILVIDRDKDAQFSKSEIKNSAYTARQNEIINILWIFQSRKDFHV